MPLDINLFRKEKGGDPDAIRESERLRFRDPKIVDRIIECDKEWIKTKFELDNKRKELGQLQK